jgi:hypothetical protein
MDLDLDPDPGSPKTCGSGGFGFATLGKFIPAYGFKNL